MEYEKNGQFKEQKAWLGKGIKFSISKIRRSKGQFAKSIEYLPPDTDEEFGAEIGISTQKLHARGPLGLKQLTSEKYIAVGNGTKDEEMVLKVGDTVLYGKYAGTELEVEGTKYLIMRQSDVLAVLG